MKLAKRWRAGFGVWMASLGVLAPGCEVARTEVIVRVESELPWGESQAVQSVVLEVRRGGATGPQRSLRTTVLGRGTGRSGLPLRVWVLESSDDLETPLWIEALGCGNPNGCTRGDAVVAQRALVRFVPERTVELPLLLAAACAGVRCGAEERCEVRTGMCRPATEAVTVPWMGVVDAGVGAGIDAGIDVIDPGDQGAREDAGVDAELDAGGDVSFDAGVEVGTETGTDTGTVTTLDVGLDASRDAGADAGDDGGRDVGLPPSDVGPACGAAEQMCEGRCVNTQTSTSHCGACGHRCPVLGGSPVCFRGQCTFGVCDLGRGNCDANFGNGCESDLSVGILNCGACGRVCGLGEICVAGVCGLSCPASQFVCGSTCFSPAASCSVGLGACARSGASVCDLEVLKVGVGQSHTCVIRRDGSVWCWGDNSRGQLGDGTVSSRSAVPVRVRELVGASRLAIGYNYSCAVLPGGTVRCWGDNSSGQLGDGTNELRRPVPVEVVGLRGAVEVIAGVWHTCARLEGGSMVCWGRNTSGQLGNGSLLPALAAVEVASLRGVVSVGVGTSHTCAVLMGGSVYCWGSNSRGQLGDGGIEDRAVPSLVRGLSGATSVDAGYQHTCARLTDGTVHCWGLNAAGQLGASTGGTGVSRSFPVAVVGLSSVEAIDLGDIYSCARLVGGQVSCWGYNTYGQLGDGTTQMRLDARLVSGLNSVVELSAGVRHACALSRSGSLSCWGYNDYRQLGAASSSNVHTTPTPVRILPDPVQCSATPGAPVAEVCGDGVDNDCDGVVDNGC